MVPVDGGESACGGARGANAAPQRMPRTADLAAPKILFSSLPINVRSVGERGNGHDLRKSSEELDNHGGIFQ